MRAASSWAGMVPAASMATSTPWPPVSASTRAARWSSGLRLTAPNSAAASRRYASGSTARIGTAPAMRAIATRSSPIGPQPTTATDSPTRGLARSQEWSATPSGSSRAPCSAVIPFGKGKRNSDR